MSRNFKGVVTLAVAAAACALAVPAASAQSAILTSDGPVTIIGNYLGAETINAYTAFGNKAECPNGMGTGHKVSSTPHQLVPSGATEITTTPHPGICIMIAAGISFPGTADMNGCDGVVEVGETTGGVKNTYGGRVTIVCPPGKHIQMTSFASEAKHLAGEPFCMTTVTPKAGGYTGLHAIDLENGTIKVSGTSSGITVHRSSPIGSFLCTPQTTNEAAVHVEAIIKGRNAGGAPTAISLSD
jgi:hypothetical protein